MAALEIELERPNIPLISSEEYQTLDKEIMITTVESDGNCSSGTVTRSATGHIACRFSALVYSIIYVLLNYPKYDHYNILKKIALPRELGDTRIPYSNNACTVKKIYNSICGKSSKLHTFLLQNIITPELPILYLSGKDNVKYLEKYPEKRLFFMGILDTSDVAKDADKINSRGTSNGIISHYFLIVNRDDGYYIISSFGHDFCIPQTETKVELHEWNNFITNFNIPFEERSKKQRDSVTNFLSKHFLNVQTSGIHIDPNTSAEDFTGNKIPTPSELIEGIIGTYSTGTYTIILLNDIEKIIINYIDKLPDLTPILSFPLVEKDLSSSDPTDGGKKIIKTRKKQKTKRKYKSRKNKKYKTRKY